MNKITEALKLAEEALERWREWDKWNSEGAWDNHDDKALAAIREALAEQALQNLSDFHQYMEATEPKCSEHPDAPHGFDRNASHNADRYVCECEGWEPDEPVKQEPVAEMFLGGITDGEYGECEVDPYQRVIEALQKRLVKGGNAVRLELYAEPVDAKAIRAEALEEAAKVCEEFYTIEGIAQNCAAAIRELK